MTVDTTGYTLGSNEPLHHSRILWDFLTGTVTGDGNNLDYAANDFTNQRWSFDATGADQSWTVDFGSAQDVDTVVIAAHTLGTTGATVDVYTDDDGSDPMTLRATVTPSDNLPIAVMFNNASTPYSAQRVRITIRSGASAAGVVGIIRAGEALQMQRPLPPGAEPIGLRSVSHIRHIDSETGQWLGRTVQRSRQKASIRWSLLDGQWYRDNFQPFADTLPQKPFALIQNAVSMPESVAWCWTNDSPMPNYSEGVKKMSISLELTGYDG